MYADHDHRGEYADARHDHDDRYAGDRHRHYDTEREVDQLTGALREASAQTDLLRREHDAEIRQLRERVRQLETAPARGVQAQTGERSVTERLSPGFAVFNYHVNDAQTQARKIFITNFGHETWDEVIRPLEETGIMAIFDQEPALHYTFYITTVTLLVNGDVIPGNEARQPA